MALRLTCLLLGVSLSGCAWLFDDSVGIECSGHTCTCGQDTSSCSHGCAAGEPCSLSCSETTCDLDCNGASSCAVGADGIADLEVNCAGGPCAVSCSNGARCTVRECVAPDCRVTCQGMALVVTTPTVTCAR